MMIHESEINMMSNTVDIEQLQPISRTYQYRKVIVFYFFSKKKPWKKFL